MKAREKEIEIRDCYVNAANYALSHWSWQFTLSGCYLACTHSYKQCCLLLIDKGQALEASTQHPLLTSFLVVIYDHVYMFVAVIERALVLYPFSSGLAGFLVAHTLIPFISSTSIYSRTVQLINNRYLLKQM